MGSIELNIQYSSDYKNAKILRDIVDNLCMIFQIPSKWRTRFVLICDELNNNAIEYGSKVNEINTLNLCFTNTDSLITVS